MTTKPDQITARHYTIDFVDAMGYYLQRMGAPFDRDETFNQVYQYSLGKQAVNKESLIGLLKLAEHYLESFPAGRSIANSCHATSHAFAVTVKALELDDEIPMAITIGNVYFKNKNIYGVTRERIEQILTKGFEPGRTIDVHVWLTLPDMTVLDLTILSTLFARGLTEVEAALDKRVLVWSPETQSDYRFEPLLVDNDFFLKVDTGLVGFNGSPSGLKLTSF